MLCYAFRRNIVIGTASGIRKPMKSITDFFPSKEGSKRAASATAPQPNSPKKARIVAANTTGDRQVDAFTHKTQVAAVPVTHPSAAETAQGADPAGEAPQQLSKSALREACDKNLGLVSLRLQQASAQGTQPDLLGLLADESWRRELGREFKKPYMAKLETFLHQEWASHKVFPPQNLIFRAMNGTPFDQVRVVILGQDPYHNDGQAMGLSFSVPAGQKVPSSLQNIYKELKDDCGCQPPKHGDLQAWSDQGVLLLNAALTVRAHEANSHAKKGWQELTTAAIKALSARRRGLVFLLWGKNAQAVEPLIAQGKHHVLKSVHPSGLSAHRGFFGCKHFSKANQLLVTEGMPPIDWQIPPLTEI